MVPRALPHLGGPQDLLPGQLRGERTQVVGYVLEGESLPPRVWPPVVQRAPVSGRPVSYGSLRELAASVPSPAELPESLAAVAAPVGLSVAELGAYNQCDSVLEAVLVVILDVVLGVHADR